MKKTVRFIKNNDSTIIDNLLKVVWGKTFPKRMTWEDAEKACKKLGKGWRLPTVNELFSLVDRSRRKPAIDSEFFPDIKTDDWYWTSEPLAGDPSLAWIVYFSSGCVYGGSKGSTYYVRPVRSSQ